MKRLPPWLLWSDVIFITYWMVAALSALAKTHFEMALVSAFVVGLLVYGVVSARLIHYQRLLIEDYQKGYRRES